MRWRKSFGISVSYNLFQANAFGGLLVLAAGIAAVVTSLLGIDYSIIGSGAVGAVIGLIVLVQAGSYAKIGTFIMLAGSIAVIVGGVLSLLKKKNPNQ